MLAVHTFKANSLRDKLQDKRGFTLIELSIVLVIIGLIVGGVLVGQDLIRAAEIRATISQIEKYNTAVNTFRGKFNAIPGDMNQSVASTFGFTLARGSNPGEGDGNGVIDGGSGASPALLEDGGETASFWVDLSSAAGGNLVDGTFNTANETTYGASNASNSSMALYYPTAKLGRGNYVYVFENGGVNFFGVEAIYEIASGYPEGPTTGSNKTLATMTVSQAYNIDKKVDDGLPSTGNVLVEVVGNNVVLSSHIDSSDLGAAADTATTCFNTSTNTYSLGQNNGAGPNCALAFRFQ